MAPPRAATTASIGEEVPVESIICTDRLAAVFRTSTDPFVAPSGGRLDAITRAVRDCPSGALSYAIDGAEARDQVDWGGTRPPPRQDSTSPTTSYRTPPCSSRCS